MPILLYNLRILIFNLHHIMWVIFNEKYTSLYHLYNYIDGNIRTHNLFVKEEGGQSLNRQKEKKTRDKMGCLEGYKPALSMVVAQCIYAGVSLFTRAAIEQGLSPRIFVLYRQVIATVVLAPIAFISRRRRTEKLPSMGWRSFSFIFLAALVGITGNQNAYFEGLALTSSSIAVASTNLIPAFTFLMASVVGLENVNFRKFRSVAKLIGTLICVAGAVTLALIKGPVLLGLGSDNWVAGCLFLFASNCCWSLWLILQVPISECYPDSLSSTAWMCFFSTIQCAIVSLALDRDIEQWILLPNIELVACVYSGVIGSGVAFFLQAWCISLKGPLFAAMFYPLCTVLTTILAPVFLSETIYTGSVVGAVILIIGLYVVLWGKAGDNKDTKKGENQLQETIVDLEEPLLTN